MATLCGLTAQGTRRSNTGHASWLFMVPLLLFGWHALTNVVGCTADVIALVQLTTRRQLQTDSYVRPVTKLRGNHWALNVDKSAASRSEHYWNFVGAAAAALAGARCVTAVVRYADAVAPGANTGAVRAGGILAQKRAGRRARVLEELDWTRYHLQINFVDAVEPSYARARVARFFFERVCASRGSSSLLYCAAGGIRPTVQSEESMGVATVLPDLHADDLQNLATPPYEFDAADASMYDLIVAVDEETLQRITDRLGYFPDSLCSLEDFSDAYAELLAQERAQGWVPTESSAKPGVLNLETLQKLEPGVPLRGAPDRRPVGPALGDDLPDAWSKFLWNPEAPLVEDDLANAVAEKSDEQVSGQILRSVVGLERFLLAGIPPDMRWWNDEE